MDFGTYSAIFGAGFLGTLVAQLASLVVKRTEFNREDRARWLNHREEAYSELLRASAQAVMSSLSIGKETTPEWRADLDRLGTAMSRVRLLGSTAVVNAASALYDDTLAECGSVTHRHEQPEAVTNASIEKLKGSRTAFQNAARKELNIDS